MRQIYLDTETTGFSPRKGDRMVEIAAAVFNEAGEVVEKFHTYLNPQIEIHPKVVEVHGLTNEFLADKPLFPDVAPELLAFITGGHLVAHNAPFDVLFLDFELLLAGHKEVATYCLTVTDTLPLAKKKFVGKHSLEALCIKYAIHKEEKLHSAMGDVLRLHKVHKALLLK